MTQLKKQGLPENKFKSFESLKIFVILFLTFIYLLYKFDSSN